MRMFACTIVIIQQLIHTPFNIVLLVSSTSIELNQIPIKKTNAKGGIAAWPDVQKSGATLGNLTPADRHGSVQVCVLVHAYISLAENINSVFAPMLNSPVCWFWFFFSFFFNTKMFIELH